MHFSGIFGTKQRGSLAHAVRQITVRFLRIFVYIILKRTGHWAQGKYFFVFLFISKNKHPLFIVPPVSGYFIQIAFCHQRRSGTHISPFVIFQIFNPALQLHNHFCAFWCKQRQSLSNNVYCCKQIHFTPQLIVIAFFNILQMLQIGGKIFFFMKGRRINSLKLRLMLVSPPVSHRRRDQFVCLDTFR